MIGTWSHISWSINFLSFWAKNPTTPCFLECKVRISKFLTGHECSKDFCMILWAKNSTIIWVQVIFLESEVRISEFPTCRECSSNPLRFKHVSCVQRRMHYPKTDFSNFYFTWSIKILRCFLRKCEPDDPSIQTVHPLQPQSTVVPRKHASQQLRSCKNAKIFLNFHQPMRCKLRRALIAWAVVIHASSRQWQYWYHLPVTWPRSNKFVLLCPLLNSTVKLVIPV